MITKGIATSAMIGERFYRVDDPSVIYRVIETCHTSREAPRYFALPVEGPNGLDEINNSNQNLWLTQSGKDALMVAANSNSDLDEKLARFDDFKAAAMRSEGKEKRKEVFIDMVTKFVGHLQEIGCPLFVTMEVGKYTIFMLHAAYSAGFTDGKESK